MDTRNPIKSLKKQLRSIIEMGLERDYQKGLKIVKNIIEAWESGSMPTRDAYFTLYKELHEHDKKIEQTYDMRGSQYFFVATILLLDGTITEDDLQALPQEAREWLLAAAKTY
jgi:hypothetical protein